MQQQGANKDNNRVVTKTNEMQDKLKRKCGTFTRNGLPGIFNDLPMY